MAAPIKPKSTALADPNSTEPVIQPGESPSQALDRISKTQIKRTASQRMQAAFNALAERWEGDHDRLMGNIRQAKAAKVPGLADKAYLLPGTQAIGHQDDVAKTLPDGTKTHAMPTPEAPPKLED